ncbi:hypothetical protein HN011_009108 [Eciton burchellii]|nr:hypothetical protein HN011_009108 [Eciton burchellii]
MSHCRDRNNSWNRDSYGLFACQLLPTPIPLLQISTFGLRIHSMGKNFKQHKFLQFRANSYFPIVDFRFGRKFSKDSLELLRRVRLPQYAGHPSKQSYSRHIVCPLKLGRSYTGVEAENWELGQFSLECLRGGKDDHYKAEKGTSPHSTFRLKAEPEIPLTSTHVLLLQDSVVSLEIGPGHVGIPGHSFAQACFLMASSMMASCIVDHLVANVRSYD